MKYVIEVTNALGTKNYLRSKNGVYVELVSVKHIEDAMVFDTGESAMKWKTENIGSNKRYRIVPIEEG